MASEVVVRPHARRGTRGVRAHLRIVPASGPPVTVRLGPADPYREGVVAETLTDDPTIWLIHPPVPGSSTKGYADAYARILAHETNHIVLGRLGEQRASMMLDNFYGRPAPRSLRLKWAERGLTANPVPYELEKSGIHPKGRRPISK